MKKRVVAFVACGVLATAGYGLAEEVNFVASGDVFGIYADVDGHSGDVRDGYYRETQASVVSEGVVVNTDVNTFNGVAAFAYSRSNGLDAIGAKSSIAINAVQSFDGNELQATVAPVNPSLPAKEYVEAGAGAEARATAYYYYQGGKNPGAQDTISLGYHYDGLLSLTTDGMQVDPYGEYFGSVSYRITGAYQSEGFWGYEGESWTWSFDDEQTFYLNYDEESDAFFWENDEGDFLDGILPINGTATMDMTIFDAAYLDQALIRADYALEVDIQLQGVSFAEGGYFYASSRFYDTLGSEIYSDNVTATPQGTSPVPEPATLFLSGLGLGMTALWRRRRHW